MTGTAGQLDHPNDGTLRELTEAECWQHLGEQVVGRIGYLESGMPAILPLNYVAHDERIWLRTAPYNHLALHLPGQLVAFEIDYVEPDAHTGWSVLVRGRVDRVLAEDRMAPSSPGGQHDATPWADGTRTLSLSLTPVEVTGRELRRHDDAAAPR